MPLRRARISFLTLMSPNVIVGYSSLVYASSSLSIKRLLINNARPAFAIICVAFGTFEPTFTGFISPFAVLNKIYSL